MSYIKNEHRQKNEKRRWNGKPYKEQGKKFLHKTEKEDPAVEQARLEAIKEYKANVKNCPLCAQAISDLASAFADKTSGEPVHFDCVLKYLSEHESLSDGQSIVYIGQGRVAAARFENPADKRTFVIDRIIEWESRDKTYQWRSELADLYSKVR